MPVCQNVVTNIYNKGLKMYVAQINLRQLLMTQFPAFFVLLNGWASH